MKKRYMFLLIVVLAIGFATVSTVLYLNGETSITINTFDVIFTDSEVQNNNGTSEISNNGKTISFETAALKKVDDISVLNFTISNNSTQYDADATISCSLNEDSDIYSDYVDISTDRKNYSINAGNNVNGSVSVKLLKISDETINLGFDCELQVKALERITPGIVAPIEASQFSILQSTDSEFDLSEYTDCETLDCALNELFELNN